MRKGERERGGGSNEASLIFGRRNEGEESERWVSNLLSLSLLLARSVPHVKSNA